MPQSDADSDRLLDSEETTTLIKTPKSIKVPQNLKIPSPSGPDSYPNTPAPATPSSLFNYDVITSPTYSLRARTPRTPRTPALRSPAVENGRPPKISITEKLHQFPFDNDQKTLLRSISEVEVVTTPTSIFNFDFPLEQQSVTVLTHSTRDVNGNTESEKAIDTLNVTRDTVLATDWYNIIILAIVNFLCRIQFTVYMGALWPFLQEVDPLATHSFFAYMSSMYSVGVAISAPLIGYLSNRMGEIRRPAFASLCLMLIPNLLFLCMQLFPSDGRRYVMMVARLIVGVAAGASNILNTYWTYASQLKDRSTAAAINDVCFSLGTAIAPWFQLMFSPLGYPGVEFGFISLNMYSLPAVVAIICVLAAMFILMFFFHEKDIAQLTSSMEKRGSDQSDFSYVLPSFDMIAVVMCISIKCVQMFFYANIETIGQPFAEMAFDLNKMETTEYASMLITSSGILGFLFLLGYVWTKVGKKFDNRLGVLTGMMICVGFLLSTYPWWFYEKTMISDSCTYWWCAETTRTKQYIYTTAYCILFGIGFPLINVHLGALYSQVLGPRRQGTMHGIISLFSSLCRIVGPIAVTEIFTRHGPQVSWVVQLIVIMCACVPMFIFRKRMVPLKAMSEMKIGEKLHYKNGVVYRF